MAFRPAHIFGDESGGSDRASGAFVTAAVAIVPSEAHRLIRRFRKAARIDGEVKGHRLSGRQRAIFFDMLSVAPELGGAAVACSHHDPVGAWAIHQLREFDLYAYMMTEACLALPRSANVTLDGGRYKKSQADLVRQAIGTAVGAAEVGFGDSAALSGLQVADVIANTVFQSLGSRDEAEAARALLDALTRRGRLSIRSLCLDGVRPVWLTAN